ncbi:PREDICTED: polygalacturonase inhibitor-like [Nelumbo nucifera]|uniref:Polygalacturonase inhibitor-like n=1 Tax=Nelumbo nucifera TaxID=4432 RepID=A0A1U8AE47_NELNU|nr:PREDICTED: polygalacturonase inhibitor-like [Nelumbo nucifera]
MEIYSTGSGGSLPLRFLLFLLLVSSPLLLSPVLSASSVRCHPADRAALLRIKDSFSQESPDNFTSWDPNINCCNWAFVQCDDKTNRVNSLTIQQTGVRHIPAAIGDLPYLERLTFEDFPKLTGSIPSSFTKLQNLKLFQIWNSGLSGPIPEFLSELRNLEYLELSQSKLSGPIPSSLANLRKLATLVLKSNKLTGHIPDSFGRFNTDVTGGFTLDLSHNQLFGEIPRSLGQLDYMTIDLSYNRLVGDASLLFKENGAAQYIYLSNNDFDFDLSKVRFPQNLTFLVLTHNKVRGSIPEQVTELDSLLLFDVSYNRLCGKIPVGGNIQKLGIFSFLHNRCLCGPPLPIKCM